MSVEIFSPIPVSYVRQGMSDMGLGEEMFEAYKNCSEMPKFDEIEDGDSPNLVEIKGLIFQMTAYERKDRPSSTDVLHQVYALCLRSQRNATVRNRHFCQWQLFTYQS